MPMSVRQFGICYFPAPKCANTAIKHALHGVANNGESYVGELQPDGTRANIHRKYRTPLFENIEEVMTEDERALMKSTPGYQMG